jgi:hypothetical protein
MRFLLPSPPGDAGCRADAARIRGYVTFAVIHELCESPPGRDAAMGEGAARGAGIATARAAKSLYDPPTRDAAAAFFAGQERI